MARAEQRVLVSENAKDFAAEHGLVLLFVLKARLPASGIHVHLADLIDGWARANPDPYVGPHWP